MAKIKNINKLLKGVGSQGLAIFIIGFIVGFTFSETGLISDTLTTSSTQVEYQQNELAQLRYDGVNQVIEINQNQPTFSAEQLSMADGVWESYSELDSLNRVGTAHAMLGTKLFPTEGREPLYVDPTGWKQKKLEEGGWLYNRSHLIGFQLTGQNNNLRNLMTGTRSFNTPYMLAYENDIRQYLEETDNHVRYMVEPIFYEEELVARGIHLMAQSIEDNGLAFNVYIFNVQDGYEIHYQDGTSQPIGAGK